MTKDEYNKKVAEIDKERAFKSNVLFKEYAEANNRVCVGDIIEGNGIRIQVEKFGFYVDGGYPKCSYSGLRLRKKDSTPLISREQGAVYRVDRMIGVDNPNLKVKAAQ